MDRRTLQPVEFIPKIANYPRLTPHMHDTPQELAYNAIILWGQNLILSDQNVRFVGKENSMLPLAG